VKSAEVSREESERTERELENELEEELKLFDGLRVKDEHQQTAELPYRQRSKSRRVKRVNHQTTRRVVNSLLTQTDSVSVNNNRKGGDSNGYNY